MKNTEYEIIASSPWVALRGFNTNRVVIRKNNIELVVHYEIQYPFGNSFEQGEYYTISNADALKLAWKNFNNRVEWLIREVGKDIELSLVSGELQLTEGSK